jgi:uncharacterized protein (DUF1778 family)
LSQVGNKADEKKGKKMKDKNIHIRVSAAEHAAIMQAARKQGMTVSAYILSIVKGGGK